MTVIGPGDERSVDLLEHGVHSVAGFIGCLGEVGDYEIAIWAGF